MHKKLHDIGHSSPVFYLATKCSFAFYRRIAWPALGVIFPCQSKCVELRIHFCLLVPFNKIVRLSLSSFSSGVVCFTDHINGSQSICTSLYEDGFEGPIRFGPVILGSSFSREPNSSMFGWRSDRQLRGRIDGEVIRFFFVILCACQGNDRYTPCIHIMINSNCM